MKVKFKLDKPCSNKWIKAGKLHVHIYTFRIIFDGTTKTNGGNDGRTVQSSITWTSSAKDANDGSSRNGNEEGSRNVSNARRNDGEIIWTNGQSKRSLKMEKWTHNGKKRWRS